ncbi:MAG: ATP synthase F1 subunit gamma [Candidatus Omnitrophica bacterium]|nr:ATP synthase F1 subunit gamma [Candidatus Omnitrophota bacterium]
MLQSIKQIKSRIRSVENSKKVTSAMQMISVAKLNQTQSKLFSLRPYALKLEGLMHNLACLPHSLPLEYFKNNGARDNSVLCVITSDNGLCGVYNQNVIRAAEEFLEDSGRDKVSLILIGQKGLNYFRKSGVKIMNSYVGLNARFSQGVCDKITAQLIQVFLSGEAGSVFLAYSSFGNSIIQTALVEQFLSIKPKNLKPVEYIAEPNLKNILAGLVLQYLVVKMRLVFLEAFTCEHAARTVAMKTASDNAKELLEGLVLLRNKVRQAGITQDILEIASSVEALRGE